MSVYQTIGVNQLASAGYGADYPFRKAAESARFLLGDLWLSYPDDDCGFVLPLSVTQLDGFDGESGRKDVIIEDADGNVVFDTTEADDYLATSWGNSLITLQWTKDETVLRCTMRTVPPPWDADRTWGASFALSRAAGELDGRAYSRLPRRVRSIIVGLQSFNAVDLVLAEGYNVKLGVTPAPSNDGGRRVHQLALRAKPGDGLGRVPGCQAEDEAILTVNGVGPTPAGDFTLDAEGCYRIQRPVRVTATSPNRRVEPYHVDLTATEAKSALQLFSDCGPCCACDDYVRTYEGIRRLRNRIKTTGETAEATRDLYGTAVDRWESQRACRAAQNLKLALNAEPRATLFVGGVHCNATQCCLVPTVLRTTLEYFRDGAALGAEPAYSFVCNETLRAGTDTRYEEVRYQPVVTWPIFDHRFEVADPQATSRFRNRLRFPDAQDAGDTVRVTLSLHIPDDVSNPATGVSCELPNPDDVDVPAEVAALWVTNPPPFPVRALVQSTAPVSPTAGCGACA